MKVGFQVGGTSLGDKFSACLCLPKRSVLGGKQILMASCAENLSLYGCFSKLLWIGGQPSAGLLRKIRSATYPIVGRGLMAGCETEEGLECSHGPPPVIVAKNEFIEVCLELSAAHTMVGSGQPLLEVANRAVGQRQRAWGLGASVHLPAFVQVEF